MFAAFPSTGLFSVTRPPQYSTLHPVWANQPSNPRLTAQEGTPKTSSSLLRASYGDLAPGT